MNNLIIFRISKIVPQQWEQLLQHLCTDGVDAKYLLFKIFEAYELKLKGKAISQLHIKNGNRSPEQIYKTLPKTTVANNPCNSRFLNFLYSKFPHTILYNTIKKS